LLVYFKEGNINIQKTHKKILKHLGLWERKPRPPPKATCLRATHRQAGPSKVREHTIDYSVSQLSCFPELVTDEVGADINCLIIV